MIGTLDPQVRITSPANGGTVAIGQEGTAEGSGFLLNIEVFTRQDTGVNVIEGVIRDAALVGQPNPNFPGLWVTFDAPIITPDGTVIPPGTNLAALFNIAGTDDTPGPGVSVWVGWHVLESLPSDIDRLTIRAVVIDQHGGIGFDQVRVHINGNDLTPPPSTSPGNDGNPNPSGPLVEIIAPRAPSAVAGGEQPPPPGSLHFIQINALDVAGAGIGIDENGPADDGSIFNPPALGAGGTNPSFPGLFFAFDVPFQTPTGAIFPAGSNLAAVFNIVGSELDALTGAIRVVTDWVVGGSLVIPDGQGVITLTARVTDNRGRSGTATRRLQVSDAPNGQVLTPAP